MTLKLPLLCLLLFSPPLFAAKFACQLSGEIVPIDEYPKPTNVYTKLKNDGHPMMAFGFFIAESKALDNKSATRDYCHALKAKTQTVILSGQYPDDHFHTGQRLSLRHVHQDQNVWPYWPDRYSESR